MADIFQFRRDTAANWSSVNPILAVGEIGFETDTRVYKIGDGTSAWNSLTYAPLSPEVAAVVTVAAGTDPTPPSAGKLTLYSKSVGGRIMPKWIGPSGLDTVVQEAFFGNGLQILAPGASTAFSVVGMAAPTAVGTVSHPALTSGGFRIQTRRGIVTSAAAANSASELRSTSTQCWRGDTAKQGGFFLVNRFGVSSATANQRLAVGLFGTTAAIATTQNPSALTNCIFAGWDSADTNLQIMHNDASGACTKIDLGANFPANDTTAVYEVVFFAAPNSTQVSYRVTRLDTGDMAEGVITTNIPASTTFLAWHAYMNNGGTAAAVVLEVLRMYLATDT